MIASVKPPLALKKRVLSPNQRLQPKLKLGEIGEAQAVTFLKSHHFQILDQNVVWQSQEIDIVALDVLHDEVVFVEVKTRTHGSFGDPSAAVGRRKLIAMQKVARAYMTSHPWEKDFRFDIITVLPGKITHFENITM